MVLKIRKAVSRSEEGSSLAITLAFGVLVGISLASYLTLISDAHRNIARSQSWNSSIVQAEAGVEEALTQIQNSPTLLGSDGWKLQNVTNYFKGRTNSDSTYFNAYISVATPPVVMSYGYSPLPISNGRSVQRIIKVTTTNMPVFPRGLIAKGAVTMNGKVIADSFDSTDPNYSTSGRYDSSKFKDNGSIGSVMASVSLANGIVYGTVLTGPTGTVTPGEVGNKTYVSSLGGKAGIQDSHYINDLNVTFSDAAAPYSSALEPAGGKIDGVEYDYVLDSGNYYLGSDLKLSGTSKVYVRGNATFYVKGGIDISGQAQITVGSTASLKLYVAGSSTSIAGNGILNGTGNALKLSYYGLPSNTSVSISGNSGFTGTIYAPNAALKLNGGGADNVDFSGAAIVLSASLDGHFNFHYDENLSKNGPVSGYGVASWVEM